MTYHQSQTGKRELPPLTARLAMIGALTAVAAISVAAPSSQTLGRVEISICGKSDRCFRLQTDGMTAGTLSRSFRFKNATLVLPAPTEGPEASQTLTAQDGVYDLNTELILLSDKNREYVLDTRNLKWTVSKIDGRGGSR